MPDAKSASDLLQGFLDAFNAHDVDAIMAFFTEDCVLEMPRGPAPGGRRLVGKEQVREGIRSRLDGTTMPQIATFLGVSKQRVEQIQLSAMKKLEKRMKKGRLQ